MTGTVTCGCGSEAGGRLVSISDATSVDTGHQTSSCVTQRSLQMCLINTPLTYLSHTPTFNHPTLLTGYHAPQNEEDYRCIKVNDSSGQRVRLHHYRPRTDKHYVMFPNTKARASGRRSCRGDDLVIIQPAL